jgi:Ammonium Transporter Family
MTLTIDTGDTTWMLIATGLVMMMTPALGFFEAGLIRSKNSISVLIQTFSGLGILSIPCHNSSQNCYLNLLSPCIPVGTKASFFAHGTRTRIYCGKYRENNLQEPPKSPNVTLFLFVSLIYLFQ